MSIINCVLTGDISTNSLQLTGDVKPGRIIVNQATDVEYEEGFVNGTNGDNLLIPTSKKCSSVIVFNPSEGAIASVMPVYRVVELMDVNDFQRLIIRTTSSSTSVYSFDDPSFKTTVTYADDHIYILIEDNVPGTYRFASGTQYKYIAW